MFKAKRRFVSLLTACLTAVLALVLGFAALFAPTPITTASAAIDANTRGSFVKVTAAPSDWSGDYLIVYEASSTSAYVFKGEDAAKSYITATIKTENGNKVIEATSELKNVAVAIAPMSGGYSIKTAKGYIYGASSSNKLYFNSTTQQLNTLAMSGTNVTITSNGSPLQFNTNTSDMRFRYYYKKGQKAICLYKWVEETVECNHANQTTTYEPKNDKTHDVVVTCTNDACKKEISRTNTACTVADDRWSDWTTNGGKHSKTGNCSACNATITETANCVVNAEYTRNGNTHTQVGVCETCGYTTELTENCTLSTDGYAALGTDDCAEQQHAITTTCSVCKKTETANEACSFDDGVLNNSTLTYTCQHCEYSYTEEVATYTVTYVVPNGITAPKAVTVAENFTTKLPDASTVEGYTFEGWITAELDEKTEIAPSIFKANSDYAVTEDVTLYALYSYTEGTGAFTLVTDAGDLAVGKEIVIVATTSNNALSTEDRGNNRGTTTITKSDNAITLNENVQIITLEAGTKEGTFAFKVADGYLYAASSSGNQLKTSNKKDDNASWLITIDNKSSSAVASIKAQGANTRNLLKFNASNNPPLFSCYASGQTDVSIYMKDGATYYVTKFNTCEHANQNEVIEEATCTKAGSKTVTCLDCGAELVAEILDATGHNFIDNVCEYCEKVDPASILYNGYFYLSLNGKYAGEKDDNYYKLFDFTPSETILVDYVFYFEKDGEVYNVYNLKNGLVFEGVTIETQEDYSVHISNSEGKILSHNTGYTNYSRLGFYATSNSFPSNITLTEIESIATIDSASITVGEDLKVNYYVTSSIELSKLTMSFSYGEKTVDVAGQVAGNRYVFTLPMPPQCMADTITAELKFGEFVLVTQGDYSIQTYAQNKLTAADSSDELKRLLSDMLYYGAAAQVYKNYNVDNLASNVDGILAVTENEPTQGAQIVNAERDSYPAYFTGANVWFGDVNKIYIKVNTIENVTMTINGGEEFALDSTTYVIDNIMATQLMDEYTIELFYNGELMQTLTYSIGAYAYAKAETEIGDLALALYRYGVSAKAYKA